MIKLELEQVYENQSLLAMLILIILKDSVKIQSFLTMKLNMIYFRFFTSDYVYKFIFLVNNNIFNFSKMFAEFENMIKGKINSIKETPTVLYK